MGTSRTPIAGHKLHLTGVINVLVYEAPKELTLLNHRCTCLVRLLKGLAKNQGIILLILNPHSYYTFHLGQEKPNGLARRGRLTTYRKSLTALRDGDISHPYSEFINVLLQGS